MLNRSNINSIALLLALFVNDAYAFYYEEHKLITQKALELVQKTDPTFIDQTGIKRGIDSKYLCKKLLDPTPDKCFTLADLPALAGDHAGSPLLMKWKWFSDDLKESYIFPFADIISSTRIIGEFECFSSETTISKVPHRENFASLMHKNPKALSFAENGKIIKFDSNFARSAAHNCNHFRNINIKNEIDIRALAEKSYNNEIWKKPSWLPYKFSKYIEFSKKEKRTRAKPNLEASAWYAQLHAAALKLASYEGDENLASAWLFESYALHFLQDGVSSGHIATPSSGGLSVIIVTHDQHENYSKDGLTVEVNKACLELNNINNANTIFPYLMLACETNPNEIKIYGDKMITSDKGRVTLDLSVLLTYISLMELQEAALEKQPKTALKTEEANFYNDPHWTFNNLKNRELYKTLFSWWESGGRTEASSSMELAVKEYLDADKIRALFMWPIPIRTNNTP